MKRVKLYEAEDKMIDLISDNYTMLQGLGAFGIRLGFGDKTVREVCEEQQVDCYTFLAVVNFIINGFAPKGERRTPIHPDNARLSAGLPPLFPRLPAALDS